MKLFEGEANWEKYLQEKGKVTKRIVRRQTRGNVKAQNGDCSSKEKLLSKSRQADELLKEISKKLAACE